MGEAPLHRAAVRLRADRESGPLRRMISIAVRMILSFVKLTGLAILVPKFLLQIYGIAPACPMKKGKLST